MDTPVVGLDWLFAPLKRTHCQATECEEYATHITTHSSFWAQRSTNGLYCDSHIGPMYVGKYFYRLVEANRIP
ncbi:hypothetical protein GCM10022419_016030 [Nonomuraea rosea]|uniref:Uncharacterized protein n=1 Tax=Nonomuraea rosea TaxID=638574 RepID=A0ABP6VLH6_9ACTN